MQHNSPQHRGPIILERKDFALLFDLLRKLDYHIIGPTVQNEAIVYDAIESVDELPIGVSDEQEAGIYRLQQTHDASLFQFTVGPQSWKKYLHPPQLRLWQVNRSTEGTQVIQEPLNTQKYAFFGVRACEIAAIAIQDKVFLQGKYIDEQYQSRRDHICIIAVNCGKAGSTCFCTSMGTGPAVTHDFDLALTEILESDRHCFLIESGSDLGDELLQELPDHTAHEKDIQIAQQIVAATAANMGRQLDAANAASVLLQNLEHPQWDVIAERCLACTNCTMVCPTCFCIAVEEHTDLDGSHSERSRRWDSCFTLDYSHIAGGSVRTSTKSRYRQWMTHKLATWQEQFGTSGCVGCGRCITWCPAKIDITEEVRAIQASSTESGILPQEAKV